MGNSVKKIRLHCVFIVPNTLVLKVIKEVFQNPISGDNLELTLSVGKLIFKSSDRPFIGITDSEMINYTQIIINEELLHEGDYIDNVFSYMLIDRALSEYRSRVENYISILRLKIKFNIGSVARDHWCDGVHITCSAQDYK